MEFRVGTQSWTYPEWNGVFYDTGTRAELQLKAYAEEFDYVEVDATFYGTPPSTTLARWVGQTPQNFRFSPKMPREITHERMFVDCAYVASAFFDRMVELGTKLGPVLIQLPPTLDVGSRHRVLELLKSKPPSVQCALEFRHRSWFTHDTFALCEQAGLVIAAVDAPFLPSSFAKRTLERSTAAFVYLRLLGVRNETLAFNERVFNRTAELHAWTDQLRTASTQTCFVTASNFYEGFAPETARIIATALGISRGPRVRIEQPSLFFPSQEEQA